MVSIIIGKQTQYCVWSAWLCIFKNNNLLSAPFQARNIAVCIEFKDSDEDGARPLRVRKHTRGTHLIFYYIM